jgi:hypothetical protein
VKKTPHVRGSEAVQQRVKISDYLTLRTRITVTVTAGRRGCPLPWG